MLPVGGGQAEAWMLSWRNMGVEWGAQSVVG